MKVFTGIPDASSDLLNNNTSTGRKPVLYYMINILREDWAKLFPFSALKLEILWMHPNKLSDFCIFCVLKASA